MYLCSSDVNRCFYLIYLLHHKSSQSRLTRCQ